MLVLKNLETGAALMPLTWKSRICFMGNVPQEHPGCSEHTQLISVSTRWCVLNRRSNVTVKGVLVTSNDSAFLDEGDTFSVEGTHFKIVKENIVLGILSHIFS